MHKVDHFPDRTLYIDQTEYLYFGGTSYLGMSTHPSFQKILIQQIKKWGTAYGSSRNANIQMAIYDEAEAHFANWIGSEATLAVSSGMLAGKLVLDYFSSLGSSFFHYPQSHPAIIHDLSQPLFIKDELNPLLLTAKKEQIVITADSLPALNIQPIEFNFLDEIHPNKQITLILDESHSLGLLGNEGGGIYSAIKHNRLDRTIMVSSLGKALGLAGGIIASDIAFIEEIKGTDMFISASGANPAFLATYKYATALYKNQLALLRQHLHFIDQHLIPNSNYSFDPNYPVIYCKDEHIADDLYAQQILITRFKYPTYSKDMLRIVISANHLKEDLKKLITILNKHI